MNTGFLYISVNETGQENIIKSARSLKKHMPDAKITVFIDRNIDESLFDRVVRISSRSNHPSFKDIPSYPDQGLTQKASYLFKSDYDITIFLDYDTYITDSINEVFWMMEERELDLAGVIDEGYCNTEHWYPEVPRCFPRFNIGMVAYRKCDSIKKLDETFFMYMIDIRKKSGGVGDEVAFAKALYECKDVKYAVLPPEYNCRFIFPFILRYKAKVLHGRATDIESIANSINRDTNTVRVMCNNKIIASHRPIEGLRIGS